MYLNTYFAIWSFSSGYYRKSTEFVDYAHSRGPETDNMTVSEWSSDRFIHNKGDSKVYLLDVRTMFFPTSIQNMLVHDSEG